MKTRKNFKNFSSFDVQSLGSGFLAKTGSTSLVKGRTHKLIIYITLFIGRYIYFYGLTLMLFRYKVFFYGTHEIANIKNEDIWIFSPDNKAKFAPKVKLSFRSQVVANSDPTSLETDQLLKGQLKHKINLKTTTL